MVLNIDQRQQASKILLRVLENLDITPTQYEEAIKRYQAVGAWLCAEGSPLAAFSPEVSPQGSFRIGTVIKPWNNTDQFDIDLTVKLLLTNMLVTQKQLKEMLGARLIEHKDYKRMLDDEHRRCWRLIYAEATRFHMDLVPAIPDDQYRLMSLGVAAEFCEDPMAITDREHDDYEKLRADWHKTNMKGFAAWFTERMSYRLTEAKRSFALRESMSIEEVKFYQIKTDLQRVVQLLKRHRDIMFEDDEDAPISIIITTLAARAYDQFTDDNLYDAVLNVLAKMRDHVELRKVAGKLVYWIENPVNPEENFADKWEKVDRKREFFFKWVDKVEVDFKLAFEQRGAHNIAKELKLFLGENVVTRAFSAEAETTRLDREAGNLLVNPATGTLGTQVGRRMPDHTHYGS
jgi:hypothetical protein